MPIARIATSWTGLVGGPGYSVMYARSPFSSQPSFVSFFTGLLVDLPSSVSVSIPSTGAVIDETTGKQTGVWTHGTQTTSAGQATNTFAPQAGAMVRWDTGQFLNGRRVRGRTFIIPLTTSSYSAGGVVNPATVTRIKNLADQLISTIASNPLVIWHRPVYKKDPDGGPPILVSPGSVYNVTTSTVPTKPATLNRRRDV